MNIANLPLADRYAQAKANLEASQKAVDELKAEIKATGSTRLEGAFFAVEVGLSERATLDSKLVKAILTDEQATACTKVAMVDGKAKYTWITKPGAVAATDPSLTMARVANANAPVEIPQLYSEQIGRAHV